ncbi:MAG: hypothetical protein NTZ32_14130 [Planctomycetales bacterium]|nr:hypothetical protein [Planctomycetales bacterium]
MANTYTALHYHVVFRIKRRERWITPRLKLASGLASVGSLATTT